MEPLISTSAERTFLEFGSAMVLVFGGGVRGDGCGAGRTSGAGGALEIGFVGAAGSCGFGDKILLNTRD
jgi:hypothetical protein